MTFIDWHTLKIVGEAQGKTIFQFCAQYLYYIFEVMLVILIIIYGQKAIETLIFSVLSGVMYLRLNRKYPYSYLFIAIGYLL